MKVYELIQLLGECKAGSDVEISLIRREDEMEVLDTKNGCHAYRIFLPITECLDENDGIVRIS